MQWIQWIKNRNHWSYQLNWGQRQIMCAIVCVVLSEGEDVLSLNEAPWPELRQVSLKTLHSQTKYPPFRIEVMHYKNIHCSTADNWNMSLSNSSLTVTSIWLDNVPESMTQYVVMMASPTALSVSFVRQTGKWPFWKINAVTLTPNPNHATTQCDGFFCSQDKMNVKVSHEGQCEH